MKNLTFLPILLFITTTIGYKAQAQGRPAWITPGVVLSRVNPLKGNVVVLKDAKKLYRNYCGSCHGEGGKGDGIAAAACNPRPADHTSDYVQREPDASLYWKISEGRGPMPSFKNTLTEDQIWSLVNYIRTLKAKK
jgi:mono/diheme cytochrome c family protein